MNGRRVLYIGAPYFNYYRFIRDELANQGYVVTYYNDFPNNSALLKGIAKLRRSSLRSRVHRHITSIIERHRDEPIDLVLVVSSQVLDADDLRALRTAFPQAAFVSYMWDALRVYPQYVPMMSLYDRVYSFDPEDCEDYSELRYLPLFYHHAFDAFEPQTDEAAVDLLNICTVRPNRLEFMQRFLPLLDEQMISVENYLYIHPLQYAYNRVAMPGFRANRTMTFRFKPMAQQDVIAAMARTRATIDIPYHLQSGLTMRTIETIGAQRKLVTSNPRVLDEPFYCRENVMLLSAEQVAPGAVLDAELADEIRQFCRLPFKPLPDDVRQQYGITRWVQTIASILGG